MSIKGISFAILFLIVASCGNNQTKTGTAIKKTHTVDSEAAEENSFINISFASKKDLVCGMPVSAGIADTAHYKGNVYGFCAIECKEEFVKSPESYLVP